MRRCRGERLASGDGFGDRLLLIDDIFQRGVEAIEPVFLNNIPNMGQVIRVGAVARGQNIGNKFDTRFFAHVLAVAVIREKELGVSLETRGKVGVGAEVGGSVFATVAGGHIQGARASPAIECFHAKVVVIFLGQHAVAITGLKDGHGKNGGGGNLGAGLDQHGFGDGVFEEASLAAVGGVENLGDSRGEAEDVGGVGALGGDEAGDPHISLLNLFLLRKAVLERVPFLLKITFGKGSRKTGHADERNHRHTKED